MLHNLSYEERLACLDLDTLECRRLKAHLILYYKIMHNLTPWSIDRYFNTTVHSRHTRLTDCSNDFYISAPFCRTVAYQNDFYRAAWNADAVCDENSVRLSFRLSVRRVIPDRMEERSVQIFIPYERTFSLVF